MVHVGSLREVLSEARPSWSEKDLTAVEEKLSRVGVATAQQLAELLAEINSRLLKAGQKAFNSETLAALRSRLEAKGDGRETKDEPKATGYPGQREASATAPTAAPGQGQGATAKSTATANLPQHERREAAPDQKPAPEAKDPPGPVPSTYSPSAQFGTLEALGETQLIKAVRQNDLRTAQYLLEHRADPNEKDGFGETALMEAAAQGQPNLCKLLLESLANVGYRSPTKLRAQDLAADHVKHFFNMPQSYWHDRGLRLAARQHNLRRAALLLERAKQDKQEVDVNGADGNGFTPLHVCAARAPDSDESRLFTRWLLDEKATVNATNLLGETPLILATRASADAQKSLRLSIVKLLLKSRAAVNTSDSVLHETPLMEAAGIGDSELVLTLLRAGAESARCSASGQSALDFALNDEVKWMLKNPMQATSGSPWPSRQPNSRVPPPPPQPQPQPQQPQPGPRPPFPSFVPKQPGPKTLPKKPQTYSERLQSLLAKYPGFAGSGVEMPSHAWQWSHEELELFIGSMGQFWPPGRARPSMKPGPTAGAGAAGRGRDVWERPKPSLRPHYQVLGVADGTRDQQTLKRAYRQAALKWHPDKNPNDPHAAANFQKACNAFEQICKALGFNA